MEQLHALEKSAIFSNLTYKEIESVLPCVDATVESYKKGAIICTPGECQGKVFLVLSGSLKVSSNLNATAESTMEYLLPGDSYGSSLAILGLAPNTTIRATTASQVLFITGEKLITPCASSCSAHLRVMRNLLFELSNIIQKQATKVDYLHYHSLRTKLAAFLLTTGNYQENIPFTIPMNKTTLSEYLGVSRSSMVRELAHMRDTGLIEFEMNSFVIRDLATLQSCCE